MRSSDIPQVFFERDTEAGTFVLKPYEQRKTPVP